ncbi:lipoate--protein ligase [Candidatus Altiarchaeota archaeon]
MSEIRLLDFGAKDRFFIHSVYEAIAAKGEVNTLHFCYPEKPYVSVGVHQVIERELDVEYCREHGYPIIRREVGGGAVFLEENQQFYHLIISKEDSPADMASFYEKFLQPTVSVYQRYGLPAEYKPVNDVVINGKKASGNAAKTVGNFNLLVGNVIQDFDAKTAAKIMKTPSEKYRDKIASTMEEYMTSLKKELGHVPGKDEIKQYYIEAIESLGFEVVKGKLTSEEKEFQQGLIEKFKSDEFLNQPRLRHPLLFEGVDVQAAKVKGGLVIFEGDLKAEKLVRVILALKDGVIEEISITGDFFVSPPTAIDELEDDLRGTKLDKDSLSAKLKSFFETNDLKVAGFQVDNLVEAILKAKKRSD